MRLREMFTETFRHFLVYGTGLAAARLAAFVLIPVYTRAFTVEEYGVFAILSITLLSISTTAQLGMGSSLLRSYFDYGDVLSRKRLVGTAFIIVSCSTCTFAAILGLLSRPLSKLITGSSDYAPCFWLLGITLVADSIFGLYTAQLRAEKRSLAFGLVNIAKLLITCAAAILLVLVMKRGVSGAIAANAASASLLCMAILPSLLSNSNFHFHIEESRKLLAFGIPLIPMSLSAAVLSNADRYFLMNMSGSIEVGQAIVGIYSLIYMYSNVFRIGVTEPLTMIWLPQMLAVRHSKRADQFYARTFGIYVLFSGFLVLLLTICYEHVIGLVSGHAYVGSTFVVWLILLSLVCIGSTRLLGIGMTFARKTTYSAAFYTLAGIVNTGINLMLIPRLGMLGAAIATISAAVILPVLYYWAGQKYYRLEYEWRGIARSGLVFFSLSACYFALPDLGIPNGAGVWLKLVLVGLYFPLAVILGVVKAGEIRAVMDHIRKRRSNGDISEDQPNDASLAEAQHR